MRAASLRALSLADGGYRLMYTQEDEEDPPGVFVTCPPAVPAVVH